MSIEKTEIKRNKAVYDLYSIEGYPNTFVSIKASDKFNGMVAKLCNALPEGSSDLSKVQFYKLKAYYFSLRLRDGIWWSGEKIRRKVLLSICYKNYLKGERSAWKNEH